MKTKTLRSDKVNVITLGCSKNLVDSENLITQLEANDYDVLHDSEEEANVIIVNTCGFIDLAKEESINTIIQYADLKSKGEIDKLYVKVVCLSDIKIILRLKFLKWMLFLERWSYHRYLRI